MGYDRRASDRGPLSVWYTSSVAFRPMWLLAILFGIGMFVLGYVAATGSFSDERVRVGLWTASFIAGVLSTFFCYLGTIRWARRRKRLWG